MTAQEQEMIDGLISRIRSTEVQDKDTAAEQRLQQGLAGYPDSIYVLAQTVLVQQYGLGQAQAQIAALTQQNTAMADQLQEAGHAAKSSGGSFLSHLFSSSSDQPPPPPRQSSPYQPVNSGPAGQPYPGSAYPPPSAYQPPPAYPPAGSPAQGVGGFFGGGGGFLQGAMQTAAGVAAGEMVFQGMEGLFHGFDRGGGERGFSAPGGGESVVNNYYDGDRAGAGNDRDNGNFYNPSGDASRSDSGSGSQQFADADDGNSGFSDSNSDSSGFDDSSNFDDGGSDDMSGNM